jgi:hypothetical protein
MLTPNAYGNSARYFTGLYPAAVGTLVPPARFLSGLTTSYGTISNLPIRRTNYYSGANQIPTNRLTTAGVVFLGQFGQNWAAFSLNSDWSTNTSIT